MRGFPESRRENGKAAHPRTATQTPKPLNAATLAGSAAIAVIASEPAVRRIALINPDAAPALSTTGTLALYTYVGIMASMNDKIKPLFWIASSKKDLNAMPEDVQDAFGYALFLAQTGGKHDQAKPLKGFGSAGVLEVVESEDNSTYRAVYTVKFGDAVYVLHCFQKKSTHGIATPKPDMDVIRERLKAAERHSKGEER